MQLGRHPNMQEDVRSLLTPLGYQPGDCGYCKGQHSSQRTPQTRATYYTRSKSLSVDTYQTLMDRGWRRSGTIFYKPDVLRACCPHYTIRLPAAELKPSRDQRQALNRWNTYVLGDDYIKETSKRYPKTKEEKARQKSSFDFQEVVHAAEVERLKPVGPAHRFQVTLEPDNLTDEKYELYKDYQTNVHHDAPDEIDKPGFRRFLCDSPLQRCVRSKNDIDQPLGSFHQCYRVDGRLVAMGVLDLLPHAVSGVYFLYHQDVEKWSFGKLSAMREAALTLEKGYQYYYMGFYIHNCAKMRYKGDYKPQYILDPCSYEWNLLDDGMRSLLDQNKFVSPSCMPKDEDEEKRDLAADPLPGSKFRGPDGEEWEYEDAAAAANSRASLLDIRMPGVLTKAQVMMDIDLDHIPVYFGRRRTCETNRTVDWYEGDELVPGSLKAELAEFAACLGPEAAHKITIDFSR